MLNASHYMAMAMWLPLKESILLISATSFGIHAPKKVGAEDGISWHSASTTVVSSA